jgi:hypothetical protein
LGTIAHDRGWPVVIFARKTKRVVAFSGAIALSATAAGFAYMLGRRHGRNSTLASIVRSTLTGR